MIDFKKGVTLGPLDTSHKLLIRGWRNNPAIYKWCRQNDVISDMHHERWFDNQSKDPTIKMYIINSDSVHLGVCGFTSIDYINRRAEFSLYIAPDHWGSGFGKMALETLIQHGFKNLGLHTIWGEMFDSNPAEKTFLDVGFTYEGTRKDFYFREGKFIDAHLYSIINTG